MACPGKFGPGCKDEKFGKHCTSCLTFMAGWIVPRESVKFTAIRRCTKTTTLCDLLPWIANFPVTRESVKFSAKGRYTKTTRPKPSPGLRWRSAMPWCPISRRSLRKDHANGLAEGKDLIDPSAMHKTILEFSTLGLKRRRRRRK